MPRKKKNDEPWYFKYLRNAISKIWGWSPERRKAKNRALLSKIPELYKCEKCGIKPLTAREKEVDHIIPRENPMGWDGWDNYIQRAIGVTAEGLMVVCKPCHYRKSATENNARRARKSAEIEKAKS